MPPSLLVNERGELVHAFGGASRFLRLRDGRPGARRARPGRRRAEDGRWSAALQARAQRAARRSSSRACASDAERRAAALQGRRVRRVRSAARRLAAPAGLVRGRWRARPRAARAETEIDLDQVSREQLGALEAELQPHEGEPAGGDRGARDQQRGAAGRERGAAGVERGAAEHERGAAERQRGALHGQRRVPAQDRRADRAHQRHGQPAVEHRGRHDLPRPASCASASSRRRSPRRFNLLPHDVGRPIETFAHKHRPSRAGRGPAARARERRAGRARAARSCTARSFFLRILPYRAKGAVDGVVLTLIDVSGLKAAEDALFHERYLLNSLLRERARRDLLQGRARPLHPRQPARWPTRLGLADPREAVGKTALRAARPRAPRSRCTARTRRCCARARRSTTGSSARVDADGGEALGPGHAAAAARPRRAASSGIIGIFRDVTEQKRAEEKIQEAVRRRDQFLAMLSHELRNPLGAIVTATALLKADGDRRRAAASRLLERPRAPVAADGAPARRPARGEPRHPEQDRAAQARASTCAAVARDAADAVRGPDGRARRRASRSSSTGEPLCVDGDPARLQQIQVNLLNNAAKYTPRGGHVRARRSSARATRRSSACATTASGIPPEMLDSIFDLFVQSNRTLDRAGGRAGRRAHARALAGRDARRHA